MIFKILLILAAVNAFADTASVEAHSAAANSARLPLCVDDTAEIADIKAIIKANKSNPHKYDGYRKYLLSDSKTELFARLLYAETLAANFPEGNEQVMSQAARVIGNRMRKCGGAVTKVVFERDQFASSMNVYGEDNSIEGSRYLKFLCPKDQALWSMAYKKAAAEFAKSESDTVYNYFLYKHHAGWDSPSWNYPEDRTGASDELRSYIKVFKNPAWKCSTSS